jgi:hypothetical protein
MLTAGTPAGGRRRTPADGGWADTPAERRKGGHPGGRRKGGHPGGRYAIGEHTYMLTPLEREDIYEKGPHWEAGKIYKHLQMPLPYMAVTAHTWVYYAPSCYNNM